jgi:uncharacterized protein (TIGR03066 family)
MRAILGCGLAVVLAVTAGVSADDKTEKVDGKKLIGKWEPKPDDGKKAENFVIEFAKEGKVSFTAGGGAIKADGTYKLDGNKLLLTLKLGDMEKSMTRTISKLTDTELVSKDEKGKEDTLVRIKDK